MSAVATIGRVLQTDLLSPGLVRVPPKGATEEEIQAEEKLLGRPLSEQHKALLRQWNGLHLEVVSFYGCGECAPIFRKLHLSQFDLAVPIPCPLMVGSDACGYVYVECADGKILCYDTDGGDMEELAASLDDFVDRLVFGSNADVFSDDEWLEEVRAAGLLDGSS